ncbi:choice-of-anchor H family protein [candidate division KSB1 bacterium]|nr:choice-of-anchor H family protein [candidate division KSB1 bacterium]
MKHSGFYLQCTLIVTTLVYINCSSPTKSDDIVVTIRNIWISNAVDNDTDGYQSSLRLNFDIDVSKGNITLFVKLGVRQAGLSNSTPYTVYFESAAFSITGSNSDDAVFITIGGNNQQLAHGNYDFLMQVFASSNPDRVIAEASGATYTDLKNLHLETSSEDKNLLTAWLTRTDGIFEGGLVYFGLTDGLAKAWYAISLNQPANAVTCQIKKIRISVDSDPGDVKLRVWGRLENAITGDSNLEIYSPTNTVNLNTGWNSFDVNIDVTPHSNFYVGYLQTQPSKPRVSYSTEYAQGVFGHSNYYKNNSWNRVRTYEFGIEAFVEYTIATGRHSTVTLGRWISDHSLHRRE